MGQRLLRIARLATQSLFENLFYFGRSVFRFDLLLRAMRTCWE